MILSGEPIAPADLPWYVIPLMWVGLVCYLVVIRALTADRVRSGETSKDDGEVMLRVQYIFIAVFAVLFLMVTIEAIVG